MPPSKNSGYAPAGETTQPAPVKQKRPPLTEEQKAERAEKKRNKKTWDDVIAARRERVATLRGRGLSLREIVTMLGADTILVNGETKKNPNQFTNPDTNAPFDLATIQRDCAFLEKQWKESAAAATADHRARQLSELFEVKRFAWAQRNGYLVLAVLAAEMKLLGTSLPEKVEHSIEPEQLKALTGRDGLRQKLEDLANRLTPPPQDDLDSAPASA